MTPGDLQDPSVWRITEIELLDALARLLREGLVALDWTGFDADQDQAPRFAITVRGREELATTEMSAAFGVHVRVPGIADAWSP